MDRAELEAAERLLVSPLDWRAWGVRDGVLVRQNGPEPGDVVEVQPDEVVACLKWFEAAKAAPKPPEKTLTERADELLKLFLGVGIRPGDFGIDGEQLAREAVRWCRALDDEASRATPRPEPEKKPRQSVQRGVPPQPGELNLDEEPGFYDE